MTENKITPKKLLISIVNALAANNVDLTPLLGADIASNVAEFYSAIQTVGIRNRPLSEQLALTSEQLNELFANMPSIGSVEHTKWSVDTLKLMQRKARLEKRIASGDANTPKAKSKKA